VIVDEKQLAQVMASIGVSSLHRIGGGSETDVYAATESGAAHPGGRSDGYVYKIKELVVTTLAEAQSEVATMQQLAAIFAAYLGPRHSIPTTYLLSDDAGGRYFAVAVQPYLRTARPLASIDEQSLHPARRRHIEWQLALLLRRSLRCYHDTGHMPDLYGTFSRNTVERQRMNTPLCWPWRVWLFLTQRLWSAHNLLLTDEAVPHVVLVDYDRVRWRQWWGQFYYAICLVLLRRDLLLLAGRHTYEQWRNRIRQTLRRSVAPPLYAQKRVTHGQ
jgi:hypothetical protein